MSRAVEKLKTNPAKKTKQPNAAKKQGQKSVAQSYNKYKQYEGRQYTGMKVGRSHKWEYDPGIWTETKITPDLWQISYAVTKRRRGHAPEGSGVPVGTEYHWYIVAHQNVKKLNADDYTTSMTGLKYKVAHKRAAQKKWNVSAKTQRKRMIELFKEMILQLEAEPVELQFDYKGETYSGEAVPITQTCEEGSCEEWDISLNDRHIGILRKMKSGWKLQELEDKKLIKTIGEQVMAFYQ
jgi:hypothetical protein